MKMHLIELYIRYLLKRHKELLEQIAPSESAELAAQYACVLFEMQEETGSYLSHEQAFQALTITVQDIARKTQN